MLTVAENSNAGPALYRVAKKKVTLKNMGSVEGGRQ